MNQMIYYIQSMIKYHLNFMWVKLIKFMHIYIKKFKIVEVHKNNLRPILQIMHKCWEGVMGFIVGIHILGIREISNSKDNYTKGELIIRNSYYILRNFQNVLVLVTCVWIQRLEFGDKNYTTEFLFKYSMR